MSLILSQIGSVNAQDSSNPFELVPRLEKVPTAAKKEQVSPTSTGNPFDIIHGAAPKAPVTATPKPKAKIKQAKVEQQPKQDVNESSFRQFLFVSLLGLLIVLTLIFTIFRNVIIISYRAFWNNNILNQLYRDQKAIISFPFQILYLLFFIISGFFVFVVTNYFGIEILNSNLYSLGIYILGLLFIFFGKHTLLKIVGAIFPIRKEIGNYSFTIIIFNIILGIALVPFIIFIAFGPTEFILYVIYGAFGLVIMTLLFRLIRGLFIANRFVVFHKFHFLLYICAVEIAPFLILLKVLLSKGSESGISLY